MKSLTKTGPRAIAEHQYQISLPMQGVLHDVQHAFVGLCVHAGKQVLAAMMEADRWAVCGPKGVPDAGRRAVRGGTTRSKVVLGGQRIDIQRARVRSLKAGELQLPSFTWAASADPLNAATMSAIAAGVSTRRYAKVVDRLPSQERASATSSSTNSVSASTILAIVYSIGTSLICNVSFDPALPSRRRASALEIAGPAPSKSTP